MKVKYFFAVAIGAMIYVSQLIHAQPSDVAVTVYNQDLALIRDVRSIDVKEGEQRIHFRNVAAQIDPTSVHLRSLNQPDEFIILEQNFEYDLVNPQKIMTKYIDHKVELFTSSRDTLHGTLLNSGNELVLGLPNGEIRLIKSKDIKWLNFPRLPEGLITRPTLVWLVQCEKKRQHRIETEYLTKGLDWHAEYVSILNDQETKMNLTAWVSVDNQSGMSYENAKLKLVAGEVHLAKEEKRPSYEAERTMRVMAKPHVKEKEFFEYHLYTVQRRTSLNNNQIKQITLFDASNVAIDKKFVYEGQRWPEQVRVFLKFRNSSANQLGMPFPAGKFRVYKKDVDGSMIFVGEDRIEHTPKDEWIETLMGAAFDIKAERKKLSTRKIGENKLQERYEVVFRNHKKETVNIFVIERFQYRRPQSEWEIVETSHSYTQKDARTVEFKVTVPADQQKKLQYIVNYSW